MYISLLMPAGGPQGGKDSSNFWSVPNCIISYSNFSWKVYCVLGHVIHRSKFHVNLIRSIVEIWWRSLSTCLSSQAVSFAFLNFFGSFVWHYLSIKEDSLFVCFVCHIEIFQTTVPLVVNLVWLEKPWWGGVHWGGFILFREYYCN
jgi:hypothetical protein